MTDAKHEWHHMHIAIMNTILELVTYFRADFISLLLHTHIRQICLHLSLNYVCLTVTTLYRIAGNFRLEKIFAFFVQARRGRIFSGELFYPVKILSH